MKFISRLRLLCATAVLAVQPMFNATSNAGAPPIRVMSFNLRVGTANDGEDRWENRKDYVIQTIDAFSPDLLGTQETLTFQRDYIANHFKHLTPFGVGRDDGEDKGEMAALFYDAERFDKKDGGHFWLSDTPDSVGSKGWDAALPRVASWVKLIDKRDASSLPILYVNTHFDHRGTIARAESSKLIRRKLIELGAGHRLIVSGDFNAGVGSDPYQAMFKSLTTEADAASLVDSYTVTESPLPDSLSGTFTGFDASKTGGDRIDWIAVSQDWRVRSARIDRSQFQGRLPSDHFPITAVLVPATQKSTLRVLSYNIHHARGMDGKVDLKRIAKVIRESDADIVALQEVDQSTERSGKADQAAEIAKLCDMHFQFGKAIDLQGGAYGQAILSKYPIERVRVVNLPNSGNREQRIAMVADITHEGKKYQFIGTHLDHGKEELRLSQVEAIASLLDKQSDLSIVAGDMNDTPESKTIATLLGTWTKPSDQTIMTYSSTKPKQQIDYVLLTSPTGALNGSTKGHLIVPKAESPEMEPSDHLPVLYVAE